MFATVAAVAGVGPLSGLMSDSLVADGDCFLLFLSGFAVTVVIVMAAMVGVLVEITALVYCGREIGVGTGVATKMIKLVGREFGYGLLFAIQV